LIYSELCGRIILLHFFILNPYLIKKHITGCKGESFSMACYKNGVETKKILYNSAKQLFFENGYLNTTVNDIVTNANSKLGLFSYYFQSKDALAVDILLNYAEEIIKILERKNRGLYRENDLLLIDMVEYRSFFKCTVFNQNASRFYTELSSTPAFILKNVEIRDYFFKRLMERSKHLHSCESISAKENLDLAITLSTGMEAQLCRDLCCKRFTTCFDDALDFFFRTYYHMLSNDIELINAKIDLSREITSSYKFTVGDSFKVSLLF